MDLSLNNPDLRIEARTAALLLRDLQRLESRVGRAEDRAAVLRLQEWLRRVEGLIE